MTSITFDHHCLIDSHCHLNMLESAGENVSHVLQRAKAEHNVAGVLNISVDMESAPNIIETAQAHEHVWASVGVHPCYPESVQPDEAQLLKWAEHDKVVAIGEAGLDFFRQTEEESRWQYDRFQIQLETAKKAKLPIIIHSRQAPKQTIEVLRQGQAHECGGVMHCFVEDWTCAQAALDMGFYISFSGIVTFKNAKELQNVAKKVPLDRMLVETDAPYLAPVPHRGKQNEPGFVAYVAQYLADLKGVSLPEFTQITTTNFFNCFSKAANH